MTEYLYYLLSVLGMGYFITGSDLYEPVRNYILLINRAKRRYKKRRFMLNKIEGVITCIYCCSFWVALPMYYIAYSNSEIVHMVLSGFSLMGLIWIVKNWGK